MPTIYSGQFNLDRPLTPDHYAYLCKFARSQRIKRNIAAVAYFPDTERAAVDLPFGVDGAYYVGIDVETIPAEVDSENAEPPPHNQPSQQVSWSPDPSCCGISIARSVPCKEATLWVRYLVSEFLERWGYVLNGQIAWSSPGSRGIIYADAGRIEAVEDVNPGPSWQRSRCHILVADYLAEKLILADNGQDVEQLFSEWCRADVAAEKDEDREDIDTFLARHNVTIFHGASVHHLDDYYE